MDAVTAQLHREMSSFFAFVDEVLIYFTTRYPAELVSAKRDLAQFMTEPFDRDTGEVLRFLNGFKDNTTLAASEMRVFANTFRSRIGTFSSNFKLGKLVFTEVQPELAAEVVAAVNDARVIKQEVITHYSQVADNIEKLYKILLRENELLAKLDTPEGLEMHMMEVRTLANIFLKEEIPLQEETVRLFSFPASRVHVAFGNVRARARALQSAFLRKFALVKGAVTSDIVGQKTRNAQALLVMLVLVGFCVRVYKLKSAAIGGGVKALFGRLLQGGIAAENLSPEMRNLVGLIVDVGSDELKDAAEAITAGIV